MTFGDQVRAMTDEELAYFMANEQIQIAEALATKIDRTFKFSEEDMKNTAAEWIEWLKTDANIIGLGGNDDIDV